jgi:hypothetical protein
MLTICEFYTEVRHDELPSACKKEDVEITESPHHHAGFPMHLQLTTDIDPDESWLPSMRTNFEII